MMRNDPNDAGTWAPDPAGTGRLRYYDGTAWTDHYRDAFPTGPYAPSPVEPKEHNGCVTASVVFVVGLIVVGVIVAVAWGGGEEKDAASGRTSTSAAPTTVATTAAPGETAPPATEPPAMESKGFTLQSLDVKNQFDSFSGVARIVDAEGGRSASFTVTLFAGDKVVGTMSAVVNETPADQALTVNFLSTDPYVAFDRYEFQTDVAL